MMLPINDAGVRLKANKENARAWLDGSVDSESIVRTVLCEQERCISVCSGGSEKAKGERKHRDTAYVAIITMPSVPNNL